MVWASSTTTCPSVRFARAEECDQHDLDAPIDRTLKRVENRSGGVAIQMVQRMQHLRTPCFAMARCLFCLLCNDRSLQDMVAPPYHAIQLLLGCGCVDSVLDAFSSPQALDQTQSCPSLRVWFEIEGSHTSTNPILLLGLDLFYSCSLLFSRMRYGTVRYGTFSQPRRLWCWDVICCAVQRSKPRTSGR